MSRSRGRAGDAGNGKPRDTRVCTNCDNNFVNRALDLDKQLNVTPCGHYYCQRCVGVLFKGAGTAGGAGGRGRGERVVACKAPGCGAQLVSTDLRKGTAEELEFQEEIRMRRYLRSVFNAPREAFAPGPEGVVQFNLYLEKAEELLERHMSAFTANDVAARDAVAEEVKTYVKLHAPTISLNKQRAAKEAEQSAARVEQETAARRAAAQQHAAEDAAVRANIRRAEKEISEVAMTFDDEDSLERITSLVSEVAAGSTELGAKAAAAGAAAATTPTGMAPMGATALARLPQGLFGKKATAIKPPSAQRLQRAIEAGVAREHEVEGLRDVRRTAGGWSWRQSRLRDRQEAAKTIAMTPGQA